MYMSKACTYVIIDNRICMHLQGHLVYFFKYLKNKMEFLTLGICRILSLTVEQRRYLEFTTHSYTFWIS